MITISHSEPWPTKVNFVDENNVFLGYDIDDDCCAWGGWFYSDSHEVTEIPNNKEPDGITNLDGWAFDKTYRNRTETGEGVVEQFRILHPASGRERYINLFNVHNGYYGKGFVFSINGKEEKGLL